MADSPDYDALEAIAPPQDQDTSTAQGGQPPAYFYAGANQGIPDTASGGLTYMGPKEGEPIPPHKGFIYMGPAAGEIPAWLLQRQQQQPAPPQEPQQGNVPDFASLEPIQQIPLSPMSATPVPRSSEELGATNFAAQQQFAKEHPSPTSVMRPQTLAEKLRMSPLVEKLIGPPEAEEQQRVSSSASPGQVGEALLPILPFGPGPESAIGKILMGVYGADFVKNQPETIKQIVQSVKQGNIPEALRGVASELMGAVMLGGAAKEGLGIGGEGKPAQPSKFQTEPREFKTTATEGVQDALQREATQTVQPVRPQPGKGPGQVPAAEAGGETGGRSEPTPQSQEGKAGPVSVTEAKPLMNQQDSAADLPLRSDGAVEGHWNYTITEGPAKGGSFIVKEGSTPEQVKAKMEAIEKPFREAQAPKPDWKVAVQPKEGEVPGFVQIIDPKQTEQSQSPTVESLKKDGHDVPDFSKLPKGNYSWEEAVAKLKQQGDSKGIGEEQNKLQRKKDNGTITPEEQKRFDELNKADQGKAQKEAWKKQLQEQIAKAKPAAPPEAQPPSEPTPAPKASPVTTESTGKGAPEVAAAKPAAGGDVGPGLGGARAGEVGRGEGGDTYGVAQRVREQRARAGQTDPVEPGQGISAPDSVEKGRELLKSGADPEKAVSDFEKTKRLSADDMAVARAKGEELALAARRTEEKFGTDSPEYRAAYKALSDWDARTKPMQTEWHKMGQAQQGETDIDTGSFTGLQRAFKNDTGKDFTPGQAKTAKVISKKVNVAAKSTEVARQKLYDQLELELGKVDVPVPKNLDEARMQFSKYKSGKGFSPQQVKTLWNAAKKFYLDRGVTDFDDIRNGLATDFGLKVADVTKALGQPKGAKYITDSLWKKQQDLRRVQQQAKRWLDNQTIPGYQRAIQSVPRVLFGLKVGFHGTVALGTHAPMVAFQPGFWRTYADNFLKMYKMVGSRSYYENQVQDLLRKPNYITARRAGLVNDPFQFEDYNSPDVAQYVGGLSGMGNRGYSVLKMLRQDMFDQHWNQLPKTAQIPEVAKAISDAVNHATGVVKVAAPKGANVAFFAPRLEMSRVAWLTTDPIKAADTFLDWKNSSDADKIFAVNQVKEKAWVAGTMLGLLALNQGILAATDSKQNINFSNPMKGDFLKFKAAGMTASYGNAMLSMARLPVRLYQIRSSSGGKLKNLIYPDEDTYSVLGQYGRSQLSPFASLASTLWLKADYENRPLPGSTRPVPKRLRAQGVKPYTWPEFWSEQIAPIPAEEALREVWNKGLGMNSDQITAARKAMATIAVMAATGGRLTDDPSAGQQ